jgi:hypothetical protein
MRRYFVETFVPQSAAGGCAAREFRVRSVTGDLRRQGLRVRFDRAIPEPGSELCVFVFEAESRDEAALAAELAQLDAFRISEVTPALSGPEPG